MKLSFRWYGLQDSIPLQYIRQIPNMSTIVTSVYDKKAGEVWSEESLLKLKRACEDQGLKMEVIESIPVSEDIKLGTEKRDAHIEAFKKNLELCAKNGVKCVCYNFMPVFDWLRTDMHHRLPDGSDALSYSREDFDKVDPNHLHLPGWDESYTPDELKSLLAQYQKMSHEQLFENLVYFLNAIMPICDQYDVNMAIHPDDPPWDVFSLPRIISSEADLDRLFDAVKNPHNGVTFCTGSFGAGRHNDIPKMVDKFSKAKRIFFVHLRNVLYTDDKDSFTEVGHYSKAGSIDIPLVVKHLGDNGFDGYVRPDHGRNIFGEDQKPGYGLYDRALGCAYINGLFEAVERFGK